MESECLLFIFIIMFLLIIFNNNTKLLFDIIMKFVMEFRDLLNLYYR
jgi:hypothetical protein